MWWFILGAIVVIFAAAKENPALLWIPAVVTAFYVLVIAFAIKDGKQRDREEETRRNDERRASYSVVENNDRTYTVVHTTRRETSYGVYDDTEYSRERYQTREEANAEIDRRCTEAERYW